MSQQAYAGCTRKSCSLGNILLNQDVWKNANIRGCQPSPKKTCEEILGEYVPNFKT